MNRNRRSIRLYSAAAAIGIAASLLAASAARSEGPVEGLVAGIEEHEAKGEAEEAYIFGYPLVTMEITRRVMTNVAAPEGARAPMGQFLRMKSYPDAKYRDVTAPNADTLYTTTWLDVSKEPWILSLPDMKDRYYLFPMLDGWTDVFQVPGKRTTGTGAQKYAITGPGWSGTLPAGVKQYKSPTALVWILGRIYCTGTPEDYAAVHAAQDEISVVPLSSYGKEYTPPAGEVDSKLDMKTAVREQVNKLDGVAYFKLLAELMKTNPPNAADAPMLPKLAKLGIVPGKDFDPSKLDSAIVKGIDAAPAPAQEKIMSWLKEGMLVGDFKFHDGWAYSTKAGTYGTSYRQRALITAIGLGANRPQDAIYPVSEGPGMFSKYDGKKHYVLHFEKGKLPPVKGFWSLTMYDKDYFFVDNPLNRYTLSQRNDLKPNADGSVDLYIQNDSPGKDKESNWLPAPADKFILMMRLYWPSDKPPSLIDGSWIPPQVREAR